jgi:hypothetical protein
MPAVDVVLDIVTMRQNKTMLGMALGVVLSIAVYPGLLLLERFGWTPNIPYLEPAIAALTGSVLVSKNSSPENQWVAVLFVPVMAFVIMVGAALVAVGLGTESTCDGDTTTKPHEFDIRSFAAPTNSWRSNDCAIAFGLSLPFCCWAR